MTRRWGKRDLESDEPKELLEIGDKKLVFVDLEESKNSENIARGLSTPGWNYYYAYIDANGNTRYRTESLVSMAVPNSVAGNRLVDFSPIPNPTGNINLTFENQTADFGFLTLAGSGGYQITASNGSPITEAVNVGTGTATNFSISTDGIITPTSNGAFSGQNGATIDISCDQGDATISIQVLPDTYDVSSLVELDEIMALATATMSNKVISPRSTLSEIGIYGGNDGSIVRGGLAANTLSTTDFTFYGDVYIRGSGEEIYISHNQTPVVNVRFNNGRFGIANSTAWSEGATTFPRGRYRFVITYDRSTGTMNAWVKPEGGSTTHEINSLSKTFSDSRTWGIGLGGLIGPNQTITAPNYGVTFNAAIWNVSVDGTTRDSLLVGDDPQDYNTGLIWHPTIGEKYLYNRQDETSRMYASDGPIATVLSATGVNGGPSDNMRIMTDPDNSEAVLYDAGGGSRYWAICETGGASQVELLNSTDLVSWTYVSTIFTAAGLGFNDVAPSCFSYMGNIAGVHDKFFIFLSGGTQPANLDMYLHTSDDLTTWTADAANPVYSEAPTGGGGPEDFNLCRKPDGTWFAVYEDNGIENGQAAISAATNTNIVPTGAWTPGASPLFDPDIGQNSSGRFIANPVIARRGAVYYVFYEGVGIDDRKTLMRTSTDLLNWETWGAVNPSGQWFPNSVLVDANGVMWIYVINANATSSSRFRLDPRRSRFTSNVNLP